MFLWAAFNCELKPIGPFYTKDLVAGAEFPLIGKRLRQCLQRGGSSVIGMSTIVLSSVYLSLPPLLYLLGRVCVPWHLSCSSQTHRDFSRLPSTISPPRHLASQEDERIPTCDDYTVPAAVIDTYLGKGFRCGGFRILRDAWYRARSLH
jgi:hypothetical protein